MSWKCSGNPNESCIVYAKELKYLIKYEFFVDSLFVNFVTQLIRNIFT